MPQCCSRGCLVGGFHLSFDEVGSCGANLVLVQKPGSRGGPDCQCLGGTVGTKPITSGNEQRIAGGNPAPSVCKLVYPDWRTSLSRFGRAVQERRSSLRVYGYLLALCCWCGARHLSWLLPHAGRFPSFLFPPVLSCKAALEEMFKLFVHLFACCFFLPLLNVVPLNKKA